MLILNPYSKLSSISMTSEKKWSMILCKKKSWATDEKNLQGPPSCPVHQVAWEWESWHQWRKLQCVEKSLHYLQIRKSILVIADTKDIAHACITCATSPKCTVILQQQGPIEQIQTETVVPWLSDAITCYHKVHLLCVCVTLDCCSWYFLGINSDDYWFPSITRGVQFRPFCWRILPIVTLYHWDLPKCLEDESLGWMNHHTSPPTKHSARLGWTRFFWKSVPHIHLRYRYWVCIPIFFWKCRSESMTSWWFRLVIDCPHKTLGVNVSAT